MTSYREIVKSFGVEITSWTVTGSYQGDYVVGVARPGEVGFVVIGYGSCSGCDALQARDWHGGYPDLAYRFEHAPGLKALADSIERSIRWFPSVEELREFVGGTGDREANDWYWYDDEVKTALEAL